MATGISSPLALSGMYASVDGRYLAANGKPFTSVSNAESALNGFPSKLSEACVGLTVLVKESSWPKAKEYWVQPYDNNGVTAYHLEEKLGSQAEQKQSDWNQADENEKDFIKNKPTKLSQFTNDAGYAELNQVAAALANKVDKISGKQLSTEDFTTALKQKLETIQPTSEQPAQSTSWSNITGKPTDLVQDSQYVHTDNNYSDEDKNAVKGIKTGIGESVAQYLRTTEGSGIISNAVSSSVVTSEDVGLNEIILTNGALSTAFENNTASNAVIKILQPKVGCFASHPTFIGVSNITENYIKVGSDRSLVIGNIPETAFVDVFEFNTSKELLGVKHYASGYTMLEATKYIKLRAINYSEEVIATLTSGTIDSANGQDLASTTRVRTDLLSFDPKLIIKVNNGEIKVAARFYDSAGNFLGSCQNFLNNDCTYSVNSLLINTGTGSTINLINDVNQIKQVRFIFGREDNGGISVSGVSINVYKGTYVESNQLSISTYYGIEKNDAQKDTTLILCCPVEYGGEHYQTKILLKLPKNYKTTGIPVKSIFFKTGADGFDDIYETNDMNYGTYLQYWVDEGHPVFDCHDNTTRNGRLKAWPTPVAFKTHKVVFDFLCRAFNFDKDALYISCKSHGGYVTSSYANKNTLPVKAIGLLAPALETKYKFFGYTAAERTNVIEDLELEGDFSTIISLPYRNFSGTYSSDITDAHRTTFLNLIKANKEKLAGYMPTTLGCSNKRFDELVDIFSWEEGSYDNIILISTASTPIKIWVASDDDAVSPIIIANFINALQNSSSVAQMRTMPSGTGRHHSVDNAANAPQKTNITTKLGVAYASVPLAYYEVMQWFRKFGID